IPSGPPASFTPGRHSRKTSGVLGATTTGSAVVAPRRRKAEARWRASYSFLYGQQNARMPSTRSGKARSFLRQAESSWGVILFDLKNRAEVLHPSREKGYGILIDGRR